MLPLSWEKMSSSRTKCKLSDILVAGPIPKKSYRIRPSGQSISTIMTDVWNSCPTIFLQGWQVNQSSRYPPMYYWSSNPGLSWTPPSNRDIRLQVATSIYWPSCMATCQMSFAHHSPKTSIGAYMHWTPSTIRSLQDSSDPSRTSIPAHIHPSYLFTMASQSDKPSALKKVWH